MEDIQLNQKKEERDKLISGLFFGLSMVFLMLISKLLENILHLDFARFGIYPLRGKNLPGIILSAFIHKDWLHLFNNAVPFLAAVIGIFYFYRQVAYRVVIISELVTGCLVWIMARPSYHIGASGWVYALLSFMFFASAFSRNNNMLAITLIVIFAYGSMIWGILPVENGISWESHLMGAITGFVLALVYRKKGPPPEKYDWEDENEDIDDLTPEEIDELIDRKLKIKYWYKPKHKRY